MSFRLATSLAVLAAAIGGPALAADWGEEWAPEEVYRGAYSVEPKDWTEMGDENDGIHIETGLRYWYSMGSQNFEMWSGDNIANSTAHNGELYLRIDDYASRSYIKGIAGYSMAITGDYETPTSTGDVVDGHVGYAGADFGWNAFGDQEGSGIGGLVGYQYWNDSPRTDRMDFSTATSAADLTFDPNTGEIFFPGDSSDNNIETHALRLGFSGRAKVAEHLDITGEVAAVPYAHVGGILGSHDVGGGLTPLGNPDFIRTSETTIDGWGYGAMAELMVGVTPVENLTLRLGGRAWYLQGTYDATYTAAQIGDPVDTDADLIYDGDPTFLNQGWIETQNPFSMLRYGLVAELTYSF